MLAYYCYYSVVTAHAGRSPRLPGMQRSLKAVPRLPSVYSWLVLGMNTSKEKGCPQRETIPLSATSTKANQVRIVPAT